MGSHAKRSLGVSSRLSYGDAAHRILLAGLKEVWHWLPLAAGPEGDADEENVHQLRVSTRRTTESVRAFSDLIGEKQAASLRDNLRKIRKAADAARNIDVALDRFLLRDCPVGDGVRVRLAERMMEQRKAAYEPVRAIYRELTDAKFYDECIHVLRHMRISRQRLARQPYGPRARKCLKPVLKKFFRAAEADVSNAEALHRLRIEAKKLRYTMEIAASAFEPSIYDKLYQRFSRYQDLMGTIRDHAMAEELFSTVLAQSIDPAERAFLEGLLLAETQAHKDFLATFVAMWTKKRVEGLRRKFETCCEK